MHDVAVIGAGLSGLSAARHLSACGLDVLILEKSRGVGGRAATRRINLPDGSRLPVDHGAQFFTARDPLFRKQVDSWLLRGICFEWATGFHTWDGISLNPPDKQWRALRYACLEGMSALGGDLATSLRVERDFRVGSVVKDRDAWILHPADSSSGNPIRAHTLFCSAPVPQSLELIGEYLPEAQRGLLEAIAYGRCLAVMAFFEKSPITPEWRGIQVRDSGSTLSWMAWDSSKRAQDIPCGSLVLHASPEFSAQDGITTDEENGKAVKEMIREAAKIGGERMMSPTSTVAHLWRYAIPLGKSVADGFLRSASDDQLYLIGDGLQGGRIEGAWLSGFNAARDYILRRG